MQVTEEEISQYMSEGDIDHPLRVLSQENMTVVSTFADSASGSYSLDGMRVRESRRQPRAWGWGWESPPTPPPLCRSHSASAADVRLAPRRPAAAGRASDDADVDDWEGSLASEPPPVTDRRLQLGMAAITPDLIRGARPAHRSLPAHKRTADMEGGGEGGGLGAPAVGGPEYPWTLQRPDGASNPSVADHDLTTALAATVHHAQDSGPHPPAGLPHTVNAPRRDKVQRYAEEALRNPAEVEQYGVEGASPSRLETRHRPGPGAPPPPPPPPPPQAAGLRRELSRARQPLPCRAQRRRPWQRARVMMVTSFLPGGSASAWSPAS